MACIDVPKDPRGLGKLLRDLANPTAEFLPDNMRLDWFCQAGNAAADMLDPPAAEIERLRKNAAELMRIAHTAGDALTDQEKASAVLAAAMAETFADVLEKGTEPGPSFLTPPAGRRIGEPRSHEDIHS